MRQGALAGPKFRTAFHFFWEFQNLVVSNQVVCNFFSETLFCALLRPFALFCGLAFALFCGLAFALFALICSFARICVFLRPTAFRATAFGNCRFLPGRLRWAAIRNANRGDSCQSIQRRTLSFLSLLFGSSLLFSLAENSLLFPSFPKDFRGSHGKKIIAFLVVFPPFFQNKTRKGRTAREPLFLQRWSDSCESPQTCDLQFLLGVSKGGFCEGGNLNSWGCARTGCND